MYGFLSTISTDGSLAKQKVPGYNTLSHELSPPLHVRHLDVLPRAIVEVTGEVAAAGEVVGLTEGAVVGRPTWETVVNLIRGKT